MRLLVVSNRLPVVADEREGQVTFHESAGGLVSGISAYLDSLKGSSFAQAEHAWIGWPGVTIDDPAKQAATTTMLSALNAYPVFLAERSMDKFYHGFCNKTIWPLFHYFPTYAVYDDSFYAHYRGVNQIFCEAVTEIMQPDDVVWIHDYHLMLLPRLLRDRNTLGNWFAGLNLAVVAGHGVWTRRPDRDWQLIKPLDNSWKPTILPILQTYAERLPGAFLEEKEYSVVWHYRAADPGLGATRAREILDDLVSFTANLDVQVLQGSKVVEVKCAGVNKGAAAMAFLSDRPDFTLAVGDDRTDEDLFKVLPETAYSIRIGIRHSHARFNLRSHVEVLGLLRELAER